MLGLKERIALENNTATLVEDLLVRLDLPDSFSLMEFCQKIAVAYGMDLHTYHTAMPSEIGGLALSVRDGRTIILVNRRHVLLAEDYTILHELGHVVLGHLGPHHDADPRDELRADLFARAVLNRMIRRPFRQASVLARLKRFFQL